MKLSSSDLRHLADRLEALSQVTEALAAAPAGASNPVILSSISLAWKGDLLYSEGQFVNTVSADFDPSLGEFTVEVVGGIRYMSDGTDDAPSASGITNYERVGW